MQKQQLHTSSRAGPTQQHQLQAPHSNTTPPTPKQALPLSMACSSRTSSEHSHQQAAASTPTSRQQDASQKTGCHVVLSAALPHPAGEGGGPKSVVAARARHCPGSDDGGTALTWYNQISSPAALRRVPEHPKAAGSRLKRGTWMWCLCATCVGGKGVMSKLWRRPEGGVASPAGLPVWVPSACFSGV